MSPHTSYHDSDADDETSIRPATDSEASPTDSEPPSEEHTPTFSNIVEDARAPDTIITEWSVEECAKFLAALGLRQYCETFLGELCRRGL